MHRLKRFRVICCIFCLQFVGPAVHSQNFDINMLKSINPQYPSSTFWKTTSSSYMVVSGTAVFGSLAYAFIKSDKELQHRSYEIIIAVGINILATNGLKAAFNRTRPSDEYPGQVFVLTTSNGHSFPSGHTSLAFATATSFTLTYKKWYIAVPAYLWAGCVGYSRMYLGKHYPSDVLGGAITGAGSSLLSHWISKKLFMQKAVAVSQSNAL
ncbi:MAG: phosphatase family protein [Ferruginibacter sp.]|nr:phosphatase family protein [Ferruginibacter sp.]